MFINVKIFINNLNKYYFFKFNIYYLFGKIIYIKIKTI